MLEVDEAPLGSCVAAHGGGWGGTLFHGPGGCILDDVLRLHRLDYPHFIAQLFTVGSQALSEMPLYVARHDMQTEFGCKWGTQSALFPLCGESEWCLRKSDGIIQRGVQTERCCLQSGWER